MSLKAGSGVRPSSSALFKSLQKPLGQSKSNFVAPPWDGGTKVCSNSPGHMIKMSAMPIYGKNLKKSSSPEPKGQ